MIYLSII